MAQTGKKYSPSRSGSFRKELPDVDLETLLAGQKPPQNIEIEKAVIGAMLVDSNCLDDVMEKLPTGRCFYDERHSIIYDVIRDLHINHKPVDVLTVGEALAAQDLMESVGGAQYLAELSRQVGSAAHAEYHALTVKQHFIQRELITASSEILHIAYNDTISISDLSDKAQSLIYDAFSSNATKDVQSISDVMNKSLEELERRQLIGDKLSGVPSGFTTLDKITNGWQAPDLIILAARPGIGKTSFAINMAVEAAKQGYPTAIFSLEMSSIQLANRMILSETGLSVDKMKGQTRMQAEDWDRVNEKIRALSNAQLYLDDTPALPIMELRSKVKKLKMQKGIRLIIVDYLQLMQGPPELRGMREQEVSAISRMLKSTAKEYDVPIIALSQVSRKTVDRGGSNTRPQLSDLRESGAIEQDADMVLFIHRPGALGQNLPGDDPSQAELIIAKNRNGEVRNIDLHFESSCTKYTEATSIIPDNATPSGQSYRDIPSMANNGGAPKPGSMRGGLDDYSGTYSAGPDYDAFQSPGGFPANEDI